MRSLLMVTTAQEASDINSLNRTEADAFIIDLADSDFCGASAQMRSNAFNIFAKIRQSQARAKIYIRIHTLDTPGCKDDLGYVMPLAPDGIFLPHCHDGADVQHLAGLLAVLEAKNDLADGSTKIIASAANDAAALLHVRSFQGANRRLIGLSWDVRELAKSLGSYPIINVEGALLPPLSNARTLLLYAAKAASVSAIDTPAFHTKDAAAFQQECEAAKRDGFDGKIGLDLRQIAMINHLFSE